MQTNPSPTDLAHPELERAVMTALRPQGAGDRLRMLSLGGLSIPQLVDRLPKAVLAHFEAAHPDNPILGRRMAIGAVEQVLQGLESQGQVRRSRVRMKNALVDAWRLSGREALRRLARGDGQG